MWCSCQCHSNARMMMIGMGTPSSQSRIPRPMEESSWSLFLCQSTDARDSLDRQSLCDGDQTASQGVSPPCRGWLRPGYSRSDVLRQHPACQPRNVLASAAALRQLALLFRIATEASSTRHLSGRYKLADSAGVSALRKCDVRDDVAGIGYHHPEGRNLPCPRPCWWSMISKRPANSP